MQRPFLEKASWVAGIVSALVALWLIFVPSNKETSSSSVQGTVASEPSQPSSASPMDKLPEETPIAPSSVASCPTIEAIDAALKTVRSLSTFSQRDAGYAKLLNDVLCRADFALANRITAQMSTFSARDDGYYKIVQRMVAVGDFSGAEKVAEKLSTFSARDRARKAIVEGIRKKGS